MHVWINTRASMGDMTGKEWAYGNWMVLAIFSIPQFVYEKTV